MELHKRYHLVVDAEIELKIFLLKWEKKHNLTMVEIVRVLLSSAQDMSRFMLRAERHPKSPNKKGDEA